MEIKRCPFCGGMAIVVKDNFQYEQYQVMCPYMGGGKGGCGASSGYYETMQEAMDAWNRRWDGNEDR